MKAAGESSEVYRELDIFGILKLPCLLDKRDETLNKCRQHENLLLMFRDAMVVFSYELINYLFCCCLVWWSITYVLWLLFFQLHLLRAGDKTELQKTAGKGQKDAIFMNAMLLLVESRRNKEEALKVLNDAFRGSGRTNEVHQILSRIGGLVFGRHSDQLKLIFHGCTRTCRTHHGNKYGRAFSSQYQWILDCNVCFWEACFVKFASIFYMDYS